MNSQTQFNATNNQPQRNNSTSNSRSNQPSRRPAPVFPPFSINRQERSMAESSSRFSRKSTSFPPSALSPLLPLFLDSAATAMSFLETRHAFGESIESATNAGVTAGLLAGIARNVATANLGASAISDLAELGVHVAVTRTRASGPNSTTDISVATTRTVAAALGSWSGGRIGRVLGNSDWSEIAGRVLGGYLVNRFLLVRSGSICLLQPITSVR
jgi:hypothetical protein